MPTPMVKFVEVKGEKIKFSRFDIQEITTLEADITLELEKSAKRMCEVARVVNPLEILGYLETKTKYRPTLGDVLSYSDSITGAIDICTRSLVKSGYNQEKIDFVLSYMGRDQVNKMAGDIILQRGFEVEAAGGVPLASAPSTGAK